MTSNVDKSNSCKSNFVHQNYSKCIKYLKMMTKTLRALELPLRLLKVILQSHIINLDKNSEPIKEKNSMVF